MRYFRWLLVIAALFSPLIYAATFGTISADGDTGIAFCNGPVIFKANGTWGSGTFTVYYLSKTGSYKSWLTTTALTTDATGQVLYDIPQGAGLFVKATLAGSTSPSLAWEFIGKDCTAATP